jgi:hypothetical protein
VCVSADTHNMSDTPAAASATHAPVIHSGADVQPLLRLHHAPAADAAENDKLPPADATADATAVSVKTLEDEQPATLGVVSDLDTPGPKGDSEHASLSVWQLPQCTPQATPQRTPHAAYRSVLGD